MSRFSPNKKNYAIRSEISRDNYNEGTAARTRPFSFDEIMLSRKNKNLAIAVAEADNKSKKDITEDVSIDRFEAYRDSRYYKDTLPRSVKHLKDDVLKRHSRKDVDKTFIKEHSLAKEKYKANVKSRTNIEAELDKDGMVHKLAHGQRKDDEPARNGFRYDVEQNRSRSSFGNDNYTYVRKGEFDREHRNCEKTRDDENYRDRNNIKTAEKRQYSDYSSRKETNSVLQSDYEESRVKRRQFSSQDHEDKDHKSSLITPKEHKHISDREKEKKYTSYDEREEKHKSYREKEDRHASSQEKEHVKLASRPSKDQSRIRHSDVERSKLPNDDMKNHNRHHEGSTSGLGGYSPRKRRTEVNVKPPSPTGRSPEEKKKKRAGWDLAPVRNDNSSDLTLSLFVPKMATAPNTSTINSLIGVSANNIFIEPFQLTQATQPLRRLYVENLPASASEKEVMGHFNCLLSNAGVAYIQETQPCINCIINKEKGQAYVEFLTPEYASAALSFDGISFSGSFLKIRRPKDFVGLATSIPEKSMDAVDAICDIVYDSPHKIFVGGISRSFSSEMMKQIVSSFGTLRAYNFQVDDDSHGQRAFLEYVDTMITLKACAGLNGMKLGGKVVTAVLATPNANSEDNGKVPFYGIPEHAKPLLEEPTEVLKLKNVFKHEEISLLLESEIEEMLDDVRLECARFGSVKSVNFVKSNHRSSTDVDTNTGFEHDKSNTNNSREVANNNTEENYGKSDDAPKNVEKLTQEDNAKDGENKEEIFEPGCVLIEYRRTGASCTAAHCLHGRLFEDRAVSVQYVALNVYRNKFPNTNMIE